MTAAFAALAGPVANLMRKAASEAILPRFRSLDDGEIIEKEAGDLVTVADRAAERILADGLAAIEPAAAIVGEEAAHADPTILERLGDDLCWIIDPLDGTHNFAHGHQPFGVIIALAAAGETVAGWLYDPIRDRLCHAERGHGAFVNGERIVARTTGEDPPVAALSMLFLTEEQREQVNRKLVPYYRLVDIPRCAAEQYPRLALGENDLSFFKRTLAWDHAAGILWLEEAGGKAAYLDGSPYRTDGGSRAGLVAASSEALWDGVVTRITA